MIPGMANLLTELAINFRSGKTMGIKNTEIKEWKEDKVMAHEALFRIG